VITVAHAMGVQGQLKAVPSMAIGAFEVTPLELATVYATLASEGVRPPVHALDAVIAPAGTPVPGKPLPPRARALEPEVAYVVTALLQGVLAEGTGAGVHRYGLDDPLAGKTGTSNDAKDSWLAGYSPDRTTVVWVGYDESLPTRLGGAKGALPIWARFMKTVRPAGGYAGFARPDGVKTAVIDPTTGQLATDFCPARVTEVFVEPYVPRVPCQRHGGYWGQPVSQGDGWNRGSGEERHRHGGVRGWLDRVFGGDENGDNHGNGQPQNQQEDPHPP